MSVLFRDTTSYLTLGPKKHHTRIEEIFIFSSLDSGGPPTLPSFDLSFFANPSPPLSLMHRSDALSSPSKTSSSSSVFPLLFLHAHQNPFLSATKPADQGTLSVVLLVVGGGRFLITQVQFSEVCSKVARFFNIISKPK